MDAKLYSHPTELKVTIFYIQRDTSYLYTLDTQDRRTLIYF